jgi:hypothetical protein
MIAAGVCGALLFGSCYVKLLVDGDAQYSEEDITVVEGVLDAAGELRNNNGVATLQLWMKGRETPFRGLSTSYPLFYHPATLTMLSKGASIKVGITKAEESAPGVDRLQWRKFQSIVSLVVDGQVALSLVDYNRASARNAALGRTLLPFLLAISLGLLGWGMHRRRSGSVPRA